MKRSIVNLNFYLRASKSSSPITQIRSGGQWWTDPDRMLRYKILYFTLGIDSLPLRRTSIISVEKRRLTQIGRAPFTSSTDPTGYRRARYRQVQQWYKRIQYQEFYLQHLYTRFAWGRTRYYPSGGAKISGIWDTGIWGYDVKAVNRYSREPLPADAKLIYEVRK